MTRRDDRGRRKQCWLLAALATLGAAPLAALAQESEPANLVWVEWHAPGECPDRAYVEREIVRQLARNAPSAKDRPLRARADVTHGGDGRWHVELTTTSAAGPGHRSMAGETCRALADAAALVLALAARREPLPSGNRTSGDADPEPRGDIDRDAAPHSIERDAGRTDASADAEDPDTNDATDAANPLPSPPPGLELISPDTFHPVRRPAPPAFTTALEASVLGDVGTLPSLAPGVGARLSVVTRFAPMLRFELGGALWFSESLQPTPASFGAAFTLRTLDIATCLVSAPYPWELGACAGAELAWMVGQGTGVAATAGGPIGGGASIGRAMLATFSDVWPVLRPTGTVAYHLSSSWSLRGDLGLGIGLNRPVFQWIGPGCTAGCPTYSPGVLSGRAALGVALLF